MLCRLRRPHFYEVLSALQWTLAISQPTGSEQCTFGYSINYSFNKGFNKKSSINAEGSKGLYFLDSLKPKLTVTLTHTGSASPSNPTLTSITLVNS